MKNILIILNILFLGIVLLVQPTRAQNEPWPADASMPADSYPFAPDELDDLLAPIALYPDPLIAQILPAATFVDQIDAAARYVRLYGSSAHIDDQPWDVSVRAVAYYPDVLYMMDQKYDWTVSLGQAYVNQPDDVMEAIQRLRYRAEEVGNLASTPQQTVVIEDGYISIIPAQPSVIYVPTYDPQVVYWERPYPNYGFITFSIGFAIGAWLNRDCDWRQHRVYYHGWRGAGWIARSRSHIHDRRHIYINNRSTVINVNKRVVRYDTERFRGELRRDVRDRRERGGKPASSVPMRSRGKGETPIPVTRDKPVPPQRRPPEKTGPVSLPPRQDKPSPRQEPQRPNGKPEARPELPGKGETPIPVTRDKPVPPQRRPPEKTGPVSLPPRQDKPSPRQEPQRPNGKPEVRPELPRPGIPVERQQEPAGSKDLSRGRDSQSTPSSGYGGYGTRRDATTFRERGQSSREDMRKQPPITRPAPAPAPAPAPVRATAPSPNPRPAPVSRPGVTDGRQNVPKRAEHPAAEKPRGNRGKGEERKEK